VDPRPADADEEPSEPVAATDGDADVTTPFTIHDYNEQSSDRSLRRLPHLLKIAIAIVWRAAPRQLVLSSLLQLATGVGLAVQVLVLRRLLSTLLETSGRVSFDKVLPDVIALAAIAALVSFAGIALEVEQRMLGLLVGLHTSEAVIDTATSVDLVTYEDPVFHDRLQRAQLSAMTRPVQLAQGLLGMVGSLFAIAGIGAALLVVQPLFFALVMVAFVPAWLATSRASRIVYRFSVDQTERDRRRSYLFTILTRKEEAQEIRAFDLGRFLTQRHHELFAGLIEDTRAMLRRRVRIALAGQLASAIVIAAAVGLLVWLVTTDRIALASAGSAAGAMVLLNGRLRSLAGSAGSLYEGSLYLGDYQSFVSVAPQLAAARPTQPAPERLDLVVADGVTFTYPSRTEPSLIDASLELRRGEVVALVGENGSGKTTLAKLLAGLYFPESGAITWDSLDTTTLDPSTLRARTAVIFQDFTRYQLSAYDNIALGDHERYADGAAVEHAAQIAGIHEMLAELAAGYSTLLGPQFYGGSNVSGGQWQRIALARAFFRDAPLVILDEPTAALDARAEAALYASMGDLFQGRGVLLISHRFGSVRTADRIYVLDQGRIIENGNHDELMAHDGLYAELFRLQARRYVD
jgi:ATP-binding cassette subfamily B protein